MIHRSECRVLHLAAAAPADLLPGGWDTLTTSLRSLGVDSDFALTRDVPVELRPESVPVHVLPSIRRWDLVPYRSWLRLIRRIRPQIVQVWGPQAVGLGLASRACFRRIPHVFVAETGPSETSWQLRLVRRFDAIIAGSSMGLARWLEGKRPPKIVASIPPCLPRWEGAECVDVEDVAGLPAKARVILTAGPLEPGFGVREAIWVFDILKYLDPTLWLIVLGDGTWRKPLEEFAVSLGREDRRVRFLGWRNDGLLWVRRAALVWLLGHRGGLGLMQAAADWGTPVLARQRPELLETAPPTPLRHYVSHADPHIVAKVSWKLLQSTSGSGNPEAEAEETGADFAVQTGADRLARQWREVYERLLSESLDRT